MRILRLPSFAAALLLSHQALAYTIQALPPGVLLPPAQYGPVATFDDVTAAEYGTTTPFGALTRGGAEFSGSGVVMNNLGGESLGLYATPYGDSSNYMAILSGGSETIAYDGPRDSFGLYWGSIDGYNGLDFYDGATLVATIGGSEAGPLLLDDGGQIGYASNGYVLITALPEFNTVVLRSASNSFEFDNVVAGAPTLLNRPRFRDVASGVPEPSTWAMFGIGFVGLASLAVRRGRTDRIRPTFA
jgi:PEP-CTERM motif